MTDPMERRADAVASQPIEEIMTSEADKALRAKSAVNTTLLLLVGAAGCMATFFGLFGFLGVGMPAFGLLFFI